MYKRPPLRVKDDPLKNNEPIKFQPGSVLDRILNPPPTKYHNYVKRPIYAVDAYISLFKKNCRELGLEYKKPDIPEYVALPIIESTREPSIAYLDGICMRLRILKSGIIRVKLDTSIATLYEKYYSKTKQPPTKSVVQAYKSLGFSDKFLDNLKNNISKRPQQLKKFEQVIDSIFNKEPVKKPKKSKKKEELIEDEEEVNDEDEQDPDDIQPEEDEALDVEVDEDLEDQAQDDEEYLSD